MTDLVAVDVGGTHARFAPAEVAGGQVVRLGEAATLKVADHVDFGAAWRSYAGTAGCRPPGAVALSVAAPVGDDAVRFTNNPWVIRPSLLPEQLGVDRYSIVNDFAAVAHAVAQLPTAAFQHLCGPEAALPREGVVTVCGPGTGLGVAQLLRSVEGYRVLPTEGGHLGYAPVDAFEDALVRRLRAVHGRVSAERVCAGPAIVAIYEALAELDGVAVPRRDDRAIWAAALAGTDPLAAAALDRFCRMLGTATGDLALAHGAGGAVIAGGLGFRLRAHLRGSGFAERFVAKGRFRTMMAAVPVKLMTYPEPGLYGAAAAFAQAHG